MARFSSRWSRCAVGVTTLLAGSVALGTVDARGATRVASPWQPISFPSDLYPGAMLQLTNGWVLVQNQGPDNNGNRGWWELSPSASGSYVSGTWHQLASLPSGYGPIAFASAVLPDGRVIIEGGESNLGNDEAFTNRGAIYQPLTNRWTTVAPPKGSEWSTIGDAPGVVLANGTFMVGGSGNYTNRSQALLNPKTLKWTITGAGKVDDNEESGFALLPNGDVLTVGLNPTPDYAERYDPATGSWSAAGTVPDAIVNIPAGEIGPMVLRPNGTVLAVGATGQNAIYDVASNSWTDGPSFPSIDSQQYDVADGPAAVMPDGDVLIDASPGVYQAPSHVFVFNGTTLTETPDPPNATNLPSDYVYMLVLPTGQVLFNDRFGHMEVYNHVGAPQASWRPEITSVPTSLAVGRTYILDGRQLGGLTQGAAYGDDYQSATNYPLVRITNDANKHVTYARTFGMSSMAVTPKLASHTEFELPSAAEHGRSTLVVVANGIASTPVAVTVT